MASKVLSMAARIFFRNGLAGGVGILEGMDLEDGGRRHGSPNPVEPLFDGTGSGEDFNLDGWPDNIHGPVGGEDAETQRVRARVQEIILDPDILTILAGR